VLTDARHEPIWSEQGYASERDARMVAWAALATLAAPKHGDAQAGPHRGGP
jgi:hypothetical protein